MENNIMLMMMIMIVVYFLGHFPMGGEILRYFGGTLIYDSMLFLRNLTEPNKSISKSRQAS